VKGGGGREGVRASVFRPAAKDYVLEAAAQTDELSNNFTLHIAPEEESKNKVWKIAVEKADYGILEDVYITFSSNLDRYAGLSENPYFFMSKYALNNWDIYGLNDSGGLPDARIFNNIIKKVGTDKAVIRCSVPEYSKLEIRVYDSSGREVIVLADEDVNAGMHNVYWDGLDNSGKAVGSGVYIANIKIGGSIFQKKIVVVK